MLTSEILDWLYDLMEQEKYSEINQFISHYQIKKIDFSNLIDDEQTLHKLYFYQKFLMLDSVSLASERNHKNSLQYDDDQLKILFNQYQGNDLYEFKQFYSSSISMWMEVLEKIATNQFLRKLSLGSAYPFQFWVVYNQILPLAQNTSLRELCLDKVLDESLFIIFNELKINNSLTALTLQNTKLTFELCNHLKATLIENKHLKVINFLKFVPVDPCLDEFIDAFLYSDSIQSLKINSDKYYLYATNLYKLIAKKNLVFLDLSGNEVNENTMQFFFRDLEFNETLRELHLSQMDFTNTNLNNLMKSLLLNHSLEKLTIDTILGGELSSRWAFGCLQTLSLSGAKLNDNDLLKMSLFITYNELLNLDLSNNNLTINGEKSLIKILKACPRLRCLNLHNTLCYAAPFFKVLFHHHNLREIMIGHDEVLLNFYNNFSVYQKMSVQKLALYHYLFDTEGSDLLQKLLNNNPQLTSLHFYHTEIIDVFKFASSLKNHHTLTSLTLDDIVNPYFQYFIIFFAKQLNLKVLYVDGNINLDRLLTLFEKYYLNQEGRVLSLDKKNDIYKEFNSKVIRIGMENDFIKGVLFAKASFNQFVTPYLKNIPKDLIGHILKFMSLAFIQGYHSYEQLTKHSLIQHKFDIYENFNLHESNLNQMVQDEQNDLKEINSEIDIRLLENLPSYLPLLSVGPYGHTAFLKLMTSMNNVIHSIRDKSDLSLNNVTELLNSC